MGAELDHYHEKSYYGGDHTGKCPLTDPLRKPWDQTSNDGFGRLCRCLDYVEPRPASCANRPSGAEGAEFDLHIIKGPAGSRSASRVPDNA